MKAEYPSYMQKILAEVKEGFDKENKRLVEGFLDYCKITAGPSSIRKIEGKIIQIADVVEKPLSELTLDDVRAFLRILNASGRAVETQNDTKKVLKRFIRWAFKDWSERFDSLRDVKTRKGLNHQKINSSTLLTEEEIKKMILGAESFRFRALVVLLAESGARPEEVRNLTWNRIKFNENSVDITLISAKTGQSRTIPLQESRIHLERWRREYPFQPLQSTDCVFPSPKSRSKPISGTAVWNYIKRLSKRTIGRPVFPYLLRHTMLTKVYKTLSTQMGSKFAGHSPQMSSRYTHLSNDDLRQEMFTKIYHVEEVNEVERKKIQELEQKLEKLRAAHREEMQMFKKELNKVVLALASLEQ